MGIAAFLAYSLEGCEADEETLGPGTGRRVYSSLEVLAPSTCEGQGRSRIHVVGMRGGWEGYLDKGIRVCAPPSSPGPQYGTFQSLSWVTCPPSSGVTLDEASVAVRQKWQAEAVRAGVPWGRQREGQEGAHRKRKGRGQASVLGAKVLCYGGRNGYPPGGNLHNTWFGCQLAWKLTELFACYYQIG